MACGTFANNILVGPSLACIYLTNNGLVNDVLAGFHLASDPLAINSLAIGGQECHTQKLAYAIMMLWLLRCYL